MWSLVLEPPCPLLVRPSEVNLQNANNLLMSSAACLFRLPHSCYTWDTPRGSCCSRTGCRTQAVSLPRTLLLPAEICCLSVKPWWRKDFPFISGLFLESRQARGNITMFWCFGIKENNKYLFSQFSSVSKQSCIITVTFWQLWYLNDFPPSPS